MIKTVSQDKACTIMTVVGTIATVFMSRWDLLVICIRILPMCASRIAGMMQLGALKPWVRWLLCVTCMWSLTIAVGQAFEPLELVTPVEDPLLTRPPVLDQGFLLPGDPSPAPCEDRREKDGLAGRSPLSLFDVLDIGMCANPQVKAAWAGIKVQAAALGEARASYLPTLSAAVSRVNDNTRYPNGELTDTAVHGTAVNASLTWRLLDFGGRQASNDAAKAALEAALATHSATLQKTLFTLIGNYFDLQTARAAWQSKREAEALARSTLLATERREAKGAGSKGDTLQAKTALAKANLETSRAQGDYDKALAVMIYGMGLPANTSLQLQQDVEDSEPILTQDLDVWLERARQAHPAIVAAQRQLESARQKVIVTESDGLPTLDLSAYYYQNGRPNQGFPTVQTNENVVYLTLNVPIFEGFGRTYKIRGAQAQVEQSEATLQDTTHQITMDVVKTYSDAKTALANLEASALLLRSAEQALSSVQRKFSRGGSDVLEMLTVQATLADAQGQRIRCLGEWRAAKLRLVASAGALGRSSFIR